MPTPRLVATAIAVGLMSSQPSAWAAPGQTELISVRDSNIPVITASHDSDEPSFSGDGRFIAFRSFARDLAPGDTNRDLDVFVYERATGNIKAASVSSEGTFGNRSSFDPSLSTDGRYVAFASQADNLVAGDENGSEDVFVHDNQTGVTTRVSVDSNGEDLPGAQSSPRSINPAISGNGRFVAFISYYSSGIDLVGHIYLRDRQLGTTTFIDVGPNGPAVTSNPASGDPSISADGRYVTFTSDASNLVANDNNQANDIFLRDTQSGVTTRLSVGINGAESNGGSTEAYLSTNGRYVAFLSSASNLVPNDTNGRPDVFLLDRQSGIIKRVSLSSSGAEPTPGDPELALYSFPSVSADGRYVSFQSSATNLVPGDTNGQLDIFVRDTQANVTRRVNLASSGAQTDQRSDGPIISNDGRFVAFSSTAPSLVTGDRNQSSDVFVRDLQASTLAPVSISKLPSVTDRLGSLLGFGRVVSNTGRFVAFSSQGSTIVSGDTNNATDVFVRDRQTGTTERVSVSSSGEQGLPDCCVPSLSSNQPSISSSGRYVAFVSAASNLVPGDTNQTTDVFVRDRQAGTTSRVSIGSSGEQANFQVFGPSISLDGRRVAFYTDASNLVPGDINRTTDVFVRDRQTGTTTLASVSSMGAQGNGMSFHPSANEDGRFIAFESNATNLVPNDNNGSNDVFVHDMQTGATSRVSVGTGGVEGTEGGRFPSISADGRYIAFVSSSPNLVAGDTNQQADVFVYDRQTGTTRRVSVDSSGAEGNGQSEDCSISANGRYVAFSTFATNLVPGDTQDQNLRIFVHDLLTGVTQRAPSPGAPAGGPGYEPSLSGDGRIVAFTSNIPNLAPKDFNQESDVFAYERPTIPVVRINVGGAGFTDSRGHFWEADRNYNTGGVSSFTSPIANTVDDVLYQTERWDQNTTPELQYGLTVPNGTYLVRLHFAENYAQNFGVGRRVFDVDMEGIQRFDNIDVFRDAGARSALVKSTSVTVNDGQLNILFRHQNQNPIIDAIEVIGQ